MSESEASKKRKLDEGPQSQGDEKESRQPEDILKLNVGGRVFTTTRGTLCKHPESLLGKLFAPDSAVADMVKKNEQGEYFIDRNGGIFEPILDYLRGDRLIVRGGFALDEIKRELDFYQIPASPSFLAVGEELTNACEAVMKQFMDTWMETNVFKPARDAARQGFTSFGPLFFVTSEEEKTKVEDFSRPSCACSSDVVTTELELHAVILDPNEPETRIFWQKSAQEYLQQCLHAAGLHFLFEKDEIEFEGAEHSFMTLCVGWGPCTKAGDWSEVMGFTIDRHKTK